MSHSDSERVYSDPDLAWRVLGLLNLYRLLVATVLIVFARLSLTPHAADMARPALYDAAALGWFAAGVTCIALLKRRWPDLRVQAYLHAVFDVVALTLLLFAGQGVGSGLGLLLIVPVGAISLLVANRTAFVFASFATLGVLAQQALLILLAVADAQSLSQAGLLGVVIFIVALAAAPLANRLRESEALVRQRELDLANMAELSQYVVERLRESLVVVDDSDRIRLINESAREIIGQGAARPGALLGEISPRLLYLLTTWRQGPADPDRPPPTMVSADGLREVRAHFAPLGAQQPAPVIMFLEDVGALSERAQQSKLAALGRLSASIAHEIRNPVGAISHAVQLLAESPGLGDDDRHLAGIVRTNADRVNTIIGNVLQLSRRETLNPERMPLIEWLRDFVTEFAGTQQLTPDRLELVLPGTDVEVRVDPSHLHQVLWNLCENACKHGSPAPGSSIEIRAGRLPGTQRPFVEVADRGPGIDPATAERIFEPFFTGQKGGTGLGLFIARELAQCNRALLVHEARPGGGSVFRLIFADPQRWEQFQE